MRRKFFALALVSCLASLGAKADNGVVFYSDQNQAVTPEEVEMIVTTDSQETFNVVLSDGTTLTDVLYLTTEKPLSIDKIASEKLQWMVANEVLHLDNCKAKQVSICNVSGQTLLQQEINGSADIDIAHLQAGVYLLQTGNTSVKFVKK